MLIKLVAKNFLYFPVFYFRMQHSCFPQGFGLSSYAGENDLLETMLPAVLNILQVGRVRKRDRSTCIQLSFYCSLACAAGSFTYNIKNKRSPANFRRPCADASLMVDKLRGLLSLRV
jgi:hypothetical protein